MPRLPHMRIYGDAAQFTLSIARAHSFDTAGCHQPDSSVDSGGRHAPATPPHVRATRQAHADDAGDPWVRETRRMVPRQSVIVVHLRYALLDAGSRAPPPPAPAPHHSASMQHHGTKPHCSCTPHDLPVHAARSLHHRQPAFMSIPLMAGWEAHTRSAAIHQQHRHMCVPPAKRMQTTQATHGYVKHAAWCRGRVL
jgi:hypothetical protein